MAIFSVVTIMALFGSRSESKPRTEPMTASFRDGVYLGRRDAESGSKPMPVKGRWSSESDRRSFAAGYFNGYMVEGLRTSKLPWIPRALDNQAFEEGKLDGAADREGSHRFDLASKAKFRDAAKICGSNSACTERYRSGYATGYQHAYYQVNGKISRRVRHSKGIPENV
jgi:hypothetical protein